MSGVNKDRRVNSHGVSCVYSGPRGPDNWRRGGPTIYGSVTTHEDTRPNDPARSREAPVHQHVLTAFNHPAYSHNTATQPQAPRHDVVCERPLPGTHLPLPPTGHVLLKRPAPTASCSRPHAADTALQCAGTRLLAPPDRRNCTSPYASAPGVYRHALRERSIH
ncbi:hypothetical protein NDU88_000647 [Pleurodeles waltl]|uniref:Uncharacterized protein n=1 Tax=Pleurodeles waltl TaxID=8319 RepID=A0AAV7SA41_PLEWA|nr:hypothetical protein NDU88_000647 [Pleurodeles waltl]